MKKFCKFLGPKNLFILGEQFLFFKIILEIDKIENNVIQWTAISYAIHQKWRENLNIKICDFFAKEFSPFILQIKTTSFTVF